MFSWYTWVPAFCRGLSFHGELKYHPQAARQHAAAGWVEEGQTRQPGCQGQPQPLMETSCRLIRMGALLLRLGESQKPLSLLSPRPLPPSPGLGQAVACEQKGAFVCWFRGDRALRGQGSAGMAERSAPVAIPAAAALVSVVPAPGGGLGLSVAVQKQWKVCKEAAKTSERCGGLALSPAVSFRAFKPLSYRASVSPPPSLGAAPQWCWLDHQWDGCQGHVSRAARLAPWLSPSTSPEAGPATDPVGVGSNPSPLLFPGGRCWCYTGSTLAAGFPQKCSARGLPRHPDTALYFQQLRRLVLFKGPKYFVVSEETLGVEPYYPRSLRDWEGLPPGTAGALTHLDGFIYFFRDDQYWQFDRAKLQVVATGKWATQLPWMGCWDANGGQVLF